MRGKANLMLSTVSDEKLLENASVDGERFETKTTFSNVSGLM